MLEVMIESQENPSENPADAEGRSQSGVDPTGAASQETGSDSQTITEQRALITPMVFESQPPQSKVLVRVLSRVCDDREEVDAAVEEIGAQSGWLAHIAIQALESSLSNELQTQREGLDAQQQSIQAQTGRIDAQGREIRSLAKEVGAQGATIRENGSKIRENGSKIDALGERVGAQGAAIQENGSAIRENGSKIDALGERVDAQGKEIGSLTTEVRENGSQIRENGSKIDALRETHKTEIKSLRRENRMTLILFGLVIALGLFGWLGQGCSGPVESDAGTEASQAVAEPSEDAPSPPAATREPAAEAAGTDEPTEADAELSVADPEPRR